MYKRSIEDPARFWSEIASQFYWKKRWNPEVYSENIDMRKGAIKIEVEHSFPHMDNLNFRFVESCIAFVE